VSDSNAAKRQLRQSAVLVVATGTTAALTFGLMMIAGKTLGPAESSDLFAGIFLLFAVHTVFSPVSTAVARRVAVLDVAADAGAGRAVTDRVASLTGRVLLAFGAVVAVTLPWQSQSMGIDIGVLAAAWLAALLIALASVLRGAMRGRQAFGPLAGNMVTEAALRVGLAVAVLLVTGRADIAMAAYVVGIVAVWPHLLGWQRRVMGPGAETPVDDRSWLPFVGPLLLLAVADAGFQNYDVLFVKGRLSAADAGAYGAAATLSRALGVLVTPFVIQVVPLLAASHAKEGAASSDGARPATTGLLARLVTSYVLLSAGALLILANLGPELLSTLFGSGFDAASGVLVPHAIGALAGYLAMVLAQGLAAIGRLRIAGLYLLGFGVEIVVLPFVGDSMEGVAIALLVVKCGALAVTAVAWWLVVRRPGAAT
jgi:O-antigen/teichoic acid export membrane protein